MLHRTGTGEWSADNLTLAEVTQSMDNAVAAGANALEFMVTWCVLLCTIRLYRTERLNNVSTDNNHFAWSRYALGGVESTSFYPANDSSPLATVSDADLTALFKYAKHSHNLTVAFTPFLDPICNDPNNGCVNYWRGSLCQGFNASQFDAFFSNYSAIIVRYAKLAEASGAVDE